MFTADAKKKSGSQTVEFAGKYNVEIATAEYKLSKSNREMMTITYRVLDGDQEGNLIPYDMLIDDSADEGVTDKKFFSYKRINSFLIDGLQVADGYQFDLSQAAKLIGQKLSVNVGWDKNEYQGKTSYRANVKSYHPIMTDGSKPDINKPRPVVLDINNEQSAGSNAFGNPKGFGAPTQTQPAFGAQPTTQSTFPGQSTNQQFGDFS